METKERLLVDIKELMDFTKCYTRPKLFKWLDRNGWTYYEAGNGYPSVGFKHFLIKTGGIVEEEISMPKNHKKPNFDMVR